MKINDPIDRSTRESPGPSALRTDRRGFLATGFAGWLAATTLSGGWKPLRAEESPSDPAPKKTRLAVTVNGKRIRTVPAQFVVVPFGRGAPIGRTQDGVLYAGFSTEGPGLESILLASSDEGRTWRQRRLDWWQFFDHTLARDSWGWLFFDNRWALRSDAFGILRDGTLLWAFRQAADGCGDSGLEAECYVIRSRDGGGSWQGPFRVDKAPFPSIGNASNRMTELTDGTVLWPQRLGASSTRQKEIRQAAERSLQPWTETPFTASYVFRSTDGGRSWGERTPLPDWSFETTLLRLHSGRLMAAIRYQPSFWSAEMMEEQLHARPSLHEDGFQPSKRVYLADSEDAGHTWTRFRPVSRTLNGPTDLALGQAHGELSQLSDGTLILTTDHRYPRHEAQVLARISHDEGRTWSAEVYHLTRAGGSVVGSSIKGYGTGYASSVVLEDDTIVTMTGAGTCLRWRV